MSIDYTSYSNDEKTEDKHVNELNYHGQTPEVEDVVETEIETKEEPTEDSTTMLKVVNCEKVYVRADHSKKSDPVATVSKDAELLCIPYSEFNEEDGVLWHHVVTESGAEGYIMSDFTEEIAD